MCVENSNRVVKRRKVEHAGDQAGCRKKSKPSPDVPAGGCDFFDALPDDLVLAILRKLSSTAACPADFVNVLITYDFFAFFLLCF